MHFDKFYSKRFNSTIKIEDISDDMSNTLSFHNKYGDDIFCPECRKAQLKYISPSDNGKKKSYIATIDLNDHKEDCFYKYEYIKKSEVNEIVSNGKCERTLNRIIDGLELKDLRTDNINNTNEREKTVVVVDFDKNGQREYRKIFKKSLNKISVDDSEYYFYYSKTHFQYLNDFYKNVIKVQLVNNKFLYLQVKTNGSFKYELDENKEYYICVFGKVQKGYNDFPEIVVEDNRMILIREVKHQ